MSNLQEKNPKDDQSKKIIKDTLAEILDDLVEDKKAETGLGNNQIAEKIGIGPGQLSKVLNSYTELGISSLVKIAKYFGVTTDYLLGLSKLKSPNEDYKTVHEVTGLSDKAIEELNALVHRTKPTAEYFTTININAIQQIKAINYLIENEDDYMIFRIIADFLLPSLVTREIPGETHSPNGENLTDIYDLCLVKIQRQLIRLKENSDTQNISTTGRKKK